MKDGRKRSLHEHMMAIGVAAVIVAAVSIGINRSGMLTADILQGSQSKGAPTADVSYHVESGALAIETTKVFHDAQSLTFAIVYNPETIVPDATKSKTSYDFTSSVGKNGTVRVTLFLSGTLSQDRSLIVIPFSGRSEDITISDATMLFSGGALDSLAIQKQ